MNIFEYAYQNEVMFEKQCAEIGYKRQTTFYSDLSIAEAYGIKGVKDTYKRVVKSWLTNVVYFTEFVMCLNWKIYQHYQKNPVLARAYNELWVEADKLAYNTYKGEDLEYYLRTTD